MSDDLQELKERLSERSDEELMEMLTVSPADYRPEALEYARAELEYRRVELPEVKAGETEPVADAEADPSAVDVALPEFTCLVCGGQLAEGTLVAEKELTIIFDNKQERFVRARACIRCGNLYMVVDYKTEVE